MRVSKLLEYLETKPGMYHLSRWQERQVAEGLAVRDDLVLALKAMGRPPAGGWPRPDKKKINGIVSDAKQAAKITDGAITGTATHDLTERLDAGEHVDEVVRGLPAGAAADLRAYAFLVRENNWRVTEIERTVQCEDLGDVTGTFDREYLIPALSSLLGPGDCQYGHADRGEPHIGTNGDLPVIGDVKTERDPLLNAIHIGPQIAIYSRSRRMWVPNGRTVEVKRNGTTIMVDDGEYAPAPCVRQDVGIVVHVRDGKAIPFFVRLDAGWRAALRAYAQMLDEREAARAPGVAGAWFATMPNIREPRVAGILVEHAAATESERLARPSAVGMPAAPPVQHSVGSIVTVGGTDFVKYSEGPTLPGAGDEQVATRGADGLVRWAPAECPNCAPLNAGASATRTDGTESSGACRDCGASSPRQSTDEDRSGLRQSLIAAIWRAENVARLSELWARAQELGVAWTGPVEMAGAARRRQIECAQRALHGGTGKCACGWVEGLAI